MKITLSTKFKKDLKRYRHKEEEMKALNVILKMLKNNGRVSSEYKPHSLHGIYQGCMECHVKDNFLLIWFDKQTNTIKLMRLGTHHELFGI